MAVVLNYTRSRDIRNIIKESDVPILTKTEAWNTEYIRNVQKNQSISKKYLKKI